MDVTPREAPARTSRRGPLAVIVLVLVIAALGFVVVVALGDATLFFYNADEAVAERDELGDDRFRLQGTVVAGSVEETGTGVGFLVAYNDVEVEVEHTGDAPELFQEGIPVVVEGHWAGERVESDRILVKHDEVYVEENPDRLRDADEQGTDPETP